MKKIFSAILIFVSIMSCVLFSGCKNKFEDLEIKFVSLDGNPINSVELILDQNHLEYKNENVAVKFDGIKTEDLGQVLIYAEPNKVDVSNYVYNGTTCTVDVSATTSGSCKLYAKHLSSNKISSINVNVLKKSTSAIFNQNDYLISIPDKNGEDETIRETLIDASQIVTLNSSSSDKTLFALSAGSGLPYGVEAINYVDLTGETTDYIVGFKVSSNVNTNSKVVLYPVTILETENDNHAYDYVPFMAKPINFVFTNLLDADNLSISTVDEPRYIKEDNLNYVTIGETIHLINNDENYNSLHIKFLAENFDRVKDFYAISATTSNSNISTFVTANGEVLIQADYYTIEDETIDITFKPKNYSGEIKEFTKQVKVKGDAKPDTVAVTLPKSEDKTERDLSKPIEVFDYYASGNSEGALFNFKPKANDMSLTNKELSNIQIVLDPQLFSATFNSTNSTWNNIYADDEFKNLLDVKNPDGKDIANAKNLILISYFNRPLRFYYSDGLLLSETFSSNSSIYIKYIENQGASVVKSLQFNVRTVNSSNLTYLDGIMGAEVTVLLKEQKGVKSITLSAGEITDNGSNLVYNSYEVSKVKDVYLDRLKGKDADDQNVEKGVLCISEVFDLNNQKINTTLDVMITPKFENCVNPLMLVAVKGDYLATIKAQEESSQIEYSYTLAGGVYIGFVFDKNTDLGEYEITIQQLGSGYVYETPIAIHVYETFSIDKIDLSFGNGDYFNNMPSEGELIRPLSSYDADFIVASEQTIDLNVNLKNEVENNVDSEVANYYNVYKNNGYIYSRTISNGANVDLYFDAVSDGGSFAKLKFVKGTFNGEKQYVTLKLKIKTKTYLNIVTQGYDKIYGEADEIKIVFYIYEKLKDSDLVAYNSVSGDSSLSITRYTNEDLGYYNKDKSQANFELRLNNPTLWNYVETNVQDVDKFNIGIQKFEGEDIYYNSTWRTISTNVDTTSQTSNGISLTFKKSGYLTSYNVVITVFIYQFGNEFSRSWTVTVKKPVISDQVILNSKVNQYAQGGYYINLKQGETYKVEAENHANGRTVSNPEIQLQVAYKTGSAFQNVIEINKDVIKATKMAKNLQLIIFAKDAISISLSENLNGYNVPENFLLPDQSGAYLVVDVILSDGSEENPYLITTSNDLKDIKTFKDNENVYFNVMNDIDVHNEQGLTFDSVKCHILTNKDVNGNYYNYSIIGLTLNSDTKNMFTEFSGDMQNLNFVVDFDYTITTADVNLGVVGVNKGSLTNVSVVASGNADFADGYNYTANFGCLVGLNEGIIKYTTENMFGGKLTTGVSGKIKLSGAGKVYFGGLVGKNVGEITGLYVGQTSGESETSFVAMSNEGITSNLTINGTASFNSIDSAIGGLVGLNTTESSINGKISNVEVNANINLNTNNIGGVIGKNDFSSNAKVIGYGLTNKKISSFTYVDFDYDIFNIKSTSVIVGQDYIGGIVGLDKFGTYDSCKYQILAGTFVGLNGSNSVGGIVGYGNNSKFAYCSVYSYKWDYNNLLNSCESYDITGTNSVGGFAGNLSSSNAKEDGGNADVALIYASSVNASIDGKYGFIAQNSESALVFNAYFVGRLSNATDAFMAGISVVYWENVYSNAVWNNGGILQVGKEYISSNTTFGKLEEPVEIPSLTTAPWKTDSLNGGYPYIVKNGNPIFDVAPTNISVKIKTLSNTTKAGDDGVVLRYFDFNVQAMDSQTQKELNKHNLIAFNQLFAFTIKPNDLGLVRLNAKSSDVNVVTIVYNDENSACLQICGEGECNLTFSSVLNPNVKAVVKIKVILPSSKIVISNGIDFNNITSASILEGLTKQFFINGEGKLVENAGLYNEIEYLYKTSERFNLEISSLSNIEEYIEIVGATKQEDKYYLNNVSSFKIKSIKKNGNVDLTIKVFVNFNGTSIVLNSTTLKIVTFIGPRDIRLTYDYAVIYPNDETTIKAEIDTDNSLQNNDLKQLISSAVLGGNNADIDDIISISSWSFDSITQKEVAYFKINLGDDNDSWPDKQTLVVNFNVGGKVKTVEFVVLKQRIDTFDVKNFAYEDNKWVQGDILKPATNDSTNGGLIIIDTVPDNGYFDYLEITDLTTGEEIKFTQVDENHYTLPTADKIATNNDGKGIKLQKIGQNKIYVRTQIDSDSSSKQHTLQIGAYINGQTSPICNYVYKEINVKMMPNIIVNYLLPDGSIGVSSNTQAISGQYLANGTSANFFVETRNSNGDIVPELVEGTGIAELVESYENGSGKFYELKILNKISANLGKTIKVQFSTSAKMENGDTTTVTSSIEFTVVNFVIHSISVNNEAGEGENLQIYGRNDVPLTLEFYFDKTDISYFENGKFNDTVYRYNDSNITGDPSLTAIIEILKTINKNENAVNPILKADGENVTLEKNVLTVKNSEGERKLNLNFTLKLKDDKNWQIDNSGTHTISKQYKLNFTDATSVTEYKLIKNEEDFINMSGDANFILGNDLVFDVNNPYKPSTAVFNEFDGNGHTITIKKFAEFIDANIKAGLFEELKAGQVVKNLVVVYDSVYDKDSGNYTFGNISNGNEYYDLCNSKTTNYESATFGGIAAINSGVIYNCEVQSKIAITASVVANKATLTEIAFRIGGVVGINNATGYITNSVGKLSIYSQGNIGGFVYQNQGKIASCCVENVTLNNITNMEDKTAVEQGGFVALNDGEISMSYVDLSDGSSNISGKNVSAGFVWKNSKTIQDCYTNINKLGTHSNLYCGFVYVNNGTIKTCYANMENTGTDVKVFSNSKENLINCVEFVKSTIDINENDEHLISIMKAGNIGAKFKANNFVFGNNKHAIWTIQNNDLPTLVSTKLRVRYTEHRSSLDNQYYGLRTITENIEYVDDEKKITYSVNDLKYGYEENPYVIYNVETWNAYFKDNSPYYYILVADVDFKKSTPATSNMVFAGCLQGNNMLVNNFTLYSNESLKSIGLFKEISTEGSSYVSNLKLGANSIWAAKTEAVGTLAGITENCNLYNINLNEPTLTIVGGNAVGGVVGLVMGEFDIEQISSNVSINSTRKQITEYSIYVSRLNGEITASNIKDVYYAGSVFGILDGYSKAYKAFDVNSTRNINSGYYLVRKISVTNNVTLLGDTVGGAFGLVGELVNVCEVSINISDGKFVGAQYSGALAGENRGIIDNEGYLIGFGEKVEFTASNSACGGAVGLNLGGLIKNIKVEGNVVNNTKNSTVGGIVGRNVYGTINNVWFGGELFGYYAGGIVGSNYSSRTLTTASLVKGAFTNEIKVCKNLIPINVIDYRDGANILKKFDNMIISTDSLASILQNYKMFYYFTNEQTYTKSLNANKVLGLCVGLSDSLNSIITNYGLDGNGNLVFNGAYNINTINSVSVGVVNGELKAGNSFETPIANIITGYNGIYVTFITGSIVGSLDNWNRTYSGEMLIFTNSSNSIANEDVYIKLISKTESVNIETNEYSGNFEYELSVNNLRFTDFNLKENEGVYYLETDNLRFTFTLDKEILKVKCETKVS